MARAIAARWSDQRARPARCPVRARLISAHGSLGLTALVDDLGVNDLFVAGAVVRGRVAISRRHRRPGRSAEALAERGLVQPLAQLLDADGQALSGALDRLVVAAR